MSKLFFQFLGLERWKTLFRSLKRESSNRATPEVGAVALLSAALVTLAPVMITYVDTLKLRESASSTLPTIAFGICAILSLLIRSRLGITFNKNTDFRAALSLTHTGVALGCIPAVFVFLMSRDFLSNRHDVLTQAIGPAGQGPVLALWQKVALLFFLCSWVALTEELIFRGLFVSVVRRTKFVQAQWKRDLLAGFFSALIFGLAHWPTWGPMPAIALSGLGLGFVVAYLASGEQLGPLILYHLLFDMLSMAVTLSS